jgi:uncharacterized paraquat-inducible protein A
MMKTYLMNYQCPHCKMRLQSENTDSGKTLSCPGCQQAFTAPQAPPRPIGGWLTVYAVLMVLGLCSLGVIFSMWIVMGLSIAPMETLAITPLILLLFLPGFVLAYGFFKQRKWFVTFQMFALIANLPIVFFSLAIEPSSKHAGLFWFQFIFACGVTIGLLLYFWRSKRVKETFVT